MGMFDYIRCEYPMPATGANDLEYQTKDTPSQFMDLYLIRADGSLWREEYDIEDQSDPNATGLDALVGCATRVNKRFVPFDLTGGVAFSYYDPASRELVEWSSYFLNGKLRELHLIEDTRAAKAGNNVR